MAWDPGSPPPGGRTPLKESTKGSKQRELVEETFTDRRAFLAPPNVDFQPEERKKPLGNLSLLCYHKSMGTRHLFFFALATSSVCAQASFEMTLIVNSGSNSILRVDPENKMLLGSFGGNRLFNPTAITIDQANNEAYVLNAYASNPSASRVTVFNYNTGEFKREWNTFLNLNAVGDIDYVAGRGLYVPVGNGVRLFSASGSLVQSYNSSSFTNIYSVARSDNFDEVYGYALGGQYARWVDSSGTFAQNHTGVSNQRSMEDRPGQGFAFGGAIQNLVFHNFFSLSTTTVSVGSVVNNVTAISYGHGDTVYAGCFGTAGQSVILTFDTNGARLVDPWVLPTGNGILSMATVVAPEPGTLLASAVGLAALVRSRRKKRA